MKEHITEIMMIFIVIVLLSTVVFKVFDSQKNLVNSIRESEIKTQRKFGID